MISQKQDASGNGMRLNPFTGEWIIYAPGRSNRPDEKNNGSKLTRPASTYETTCPFCSGNEHMLSAILMEIKGKDGKWQIRVVPNRYPAVMPSETGTRKIIALFRQLESSGNHEVISESPLHDRTIEMMSLKEAGLLIEAYHRRYRDLTKDRRNKTVILFRNHGKAAGRSLSHPHSQIITLGIIPKAIRMRQINSLSYRRKNGRCLLCDIIEFELRCKIRLIYENKRFVCFVPFTTEVSFEVWIVPKIHRVDYRDISDEEKPDFADSILKVLSIFKIKLNEPDYNYVIQGNTSYSGKEMQTLHWYLQIKPRMAIPAGFEMGSGMHINQSLPESDAALLKS